MADEEVLSLKIVDILERNGRYIRPHLLDLLKRQEYESIGEIRDDISTADEQEREAIWEKADRCALLRELLPYYAPDGSVSKVGRKVVGWLAQDMRVSSQSVRRYIGLGQWYPPEIEDGDRVILVRDPSVPMNVYYSGLKAEEYGLDPLQAVLHALDSDPPLTAGQLEKWIREEYWREQGEVPPVRREWFAFRIESPGLSDVRTLLENAYETVERQFALLAERGVGPFSVSVVVTAMEPPEDPMPSYDDETMTVEA